MTSFDNFTERDRRWTTLQAAMRAAGLDAIIVGGTDFRGQKGGLRYVTDFTPFHRYAYAVLPADGEAIAVLHPVLLYCPLGPWVQDRRFSATPGLELAKVIAELPRRSRVGLVQVDQVMRVGDHAALVATLPGTVFESADLLFEAVRSVKSQQEIAGLEESARIADVCFGRLLDIVKPRLTERAAQAEMLKVCADQGGGETLFLTMYGESQDGRTKPVISAPSERPIDADKPFVFSLELAGPSGHWVEFCRIVGFEADGEAAQIADLCHTSMRGGLAAVRDGVFGSAIQAGLEAPVASSLLEICPWSGHAIGQDVIELPMIGRGADPVMPFSTGMAFALHPMIHRLDRPMLGYVADTYLLEADGVRTLSEWPLDYFAIG